MIVKWGLTGKPVAVEIPCVRHIRGDGNDGRGNGPPFVTVSTNRGALVEIVQSTDCLRYGQTCIDGVGRREGMEFVPNPANPGIVNIVGGTVAEDVNSRWEFFDDQSVSCFDDDSVIPREEEQIAPGIGFRSKLPLGFGHGLLD